MAATVSGTCSDKPVEWQQGMEHRVEKNEERLAAIESREPLENSTVSVT